MWSSEFFAESRLLCLMHNALRRWRCHLLGWLAGSPGAWDPFHGPTSPLPESPGTWAHHALDKCSRLSILSPSGAGVHPGSPPRHTRRRVDSDVSPSLNSELPCRVQGFLPSMVEDWLVPRTATALDLGRRGSANLSPCSFLTGALGISMVWLQDPPHRAWNDVWLALQGAGLWVRVLETNHVMGLKHGPGAPKLGFGRFGRA